MPKVQLRKKRSGKSASSSRPRKKAAVVKTDEEQLEIDAKDAVAEYEEERTVLSTMRSDFEEEYEEAMVALNEIRRQEDVVNQAIVTAKAKVGIARAGVGDFTCSRSFAQAGYDDKKLTEIFKNLEDPGDLLTILFEEGVIKELKVDKAASAAFAASNPKRAKVLSDAWKDKFELTPRVTVPKI